MKDGRVQNTKKQKIVGLSLGWLLVTLCVLIYGVYVIGDKAMTISQLNSDMDQARLRLEEAQRENQQLKDENASLSDDAYIEKLAREELGMTRKGEIPYIYAENK
ncbi:MAG: cell division protein FtsL [Veillonellaceae bacterium]|nr:cell division protein FtsL [Veillonellaceae bacterium]